MLRVELTFEQHAVKKIVSEELPKRHDEQGDAVEWPVFLHHKGWRHFASAGQIVTRGRLGAGVEHTWSKPPEPINTSIYELWALDTKRNDFYFVVSELFKKKTQAFTFIFECWSRRSIWS